MQLGTVRAGITLPSETDARKSLSLIDGPPDDRDTHEVQQAVATRPLEIEAFYPLSTVGVLDIEGRSVQGKLQSHNTDHFLAVKIGRVQETLISSLAPADLPPRFEDMLIPSSSPTVADVAEPAHGRVAWP